MALDVLVGGRAALPVATVRRVVRAVIAGERATSRIAAVSVTFLGPVRMRSLNRSHLRHDRPTDVIAFALPAPDGRLTGDLYLCRAVAARQARDAGVPLRQELIRLVIHGTLHLLGRDHPAGEARFRSSMWRRQERYVTELS
ncbi:MAG: rRNA maturation RNase YbeY [Gemmatimonadales bacterium]